MKKRVMTLIVIAIMLCSTVFVSAASDPAVSIVSPAQTVYGENLLVSIKITAPRTIRVSVYEEKQKVGNNLTSINPSSVSKSKLNSKTIHSVPVISSEKFSGTDNLQFYNKQIKKATPGLYRIKVDTINASGAVIASSGTRVVVMPKSSGVTGSAIFETQQYGALQWVQNLLKSIFGN